MAELINLTNHAKDFLQFCQTLKKCNISLEQFQVGYIYIFISFSVHIINLDMYNGSFQRDFFRYVVNLSKYHVKFFISHNLANGERLFEMRLNSYGPLLFKTVEIVKLIHLLKLQHDKYHST